MVQKLNLSVRAKRVVAVVVVCVCMCYWRACVCVFDVMFVHYVVVMASSLTPDVLKNCVPIPLWPTESGC